MKPELPTHGAVDEEVEWVAKKDEEVDDKGGKLS